MAKRARGCFQHPMIFFGFQYVSILNWCRISQPSTFHLVCNFSLRCLEVYHHPWKIHRPCTSALFCRENRLYIQIWSQTSFLSLMRRIKQQIKPNKKTGELCCWAQTPSEGLLLPKGTFWCPILPCGGHESFMRSAKGIGNWKTTSLYFFLGFWDIMSKTTADSGMIAWRNEACPSALIAL